MSMVGMSSSSAGCSSQSRTGSCRRVMWCRTGLGSIMGPLFWQTVVSVCRATPWTGNRRMSPPSPCSRREGRGMAGPGRCQDSLPSVSDRYPRLRGSRESTLVSPLSARSIPAPLGTRRRLRSPGSSVPLVRGVARWSVPDARPRGQLPGAPPPVLLPPAGWARLLPRKSPAWGTPVLRVL